MIPIEGVDYSFDRPSSPTALRNAGKAFACRYLAIPPNGKIINRAEADDLAGAGVWIVANWEQGGHGNTAPEVAGAQSLAQARALGIPRGRPIYASVDFDVQPSQYGAVADWLRRFDAALGGEYDGLALYGSYYVIRAGFDQGWLRWGWQTYAWSHGNREPRAQLYQYHNGVTVAGCECDLNRAYAADYGQWMPGRLPDGSSTPDEDETNQQEEEEMNSGVYYQDGDTLTYLVFNTASGWFHEFSNGPGGGPMPGGYNNALAAALGTPSWASVTPGHANVIKRGLTAVLPKDIPADLNVTLEPDEIEDRPA